MNHESSATVSDTSKVRKAKRLAAAALMLAGALGASSACSAGVSDDVGVENLGEASQALCSLAPGQCTATSTTGNLGRWPGGLIKYQVVGGTATQRANIVKAMRDWEAVSDWIIRFSPEAGTASHPQVRITVTAGGGAAPGFDTCLGSPNNICDATMNESNAYHELGHIIGFKHEAQRFDRNRYIKYSIEGHTGDPANPIIDTNCSDEFNVARTNSSSLIGMLGPFDYKSTMMYNVTHPDITRWDDTPLIAGTLCDAVGAASLPAQCSNADCTGANCNGSLGRCPTCAACTKAQPYGLPTKGDGAAVVEMYQNAANPRWKVFKRAKDDNGANKPFAYSLDGVSTIPSKRRLDAAAYPSGSIDIHVTGSNSRVWEKTKSGSSFSVWTDLGAIPGAGTVSDPASVSWGSGRLDIVVRRGSTIYIKTWVSGVGFGAWQSLGTPGSTPASSPAIASWGANRLDVFVRGTNNQLYWKKCTANCNGNSGTWSGWSAIAGGTLLGRPTAVGREPGVVDVFIHGMDHKLWGVEMINDSWSGFYLANNGGTLQWDASCPGGIAADQEFHCSSPAVMSRGPGKLDVLIRGQDDQMWITSWASPAPSWTGYAALGGVLTSSPAGIAKARTTDRIDTFVLMAEEYDLSTVAYGPWWKEYTE